MAQDGRLAVISDDGAVLQPMCRAAFCRCRWWSARAPIPRVISWRCSRYPQVHSATKAAIFVGERRWNLRLRTVSTSGCRKTTSATLAALSKLDKEDRLFSRDIVAVDMRLPDRLTVQLSEDAAKARDELFKDKKSKKKAGDA